VVGIPIVRQLLGPKVHGSAYIAAWTTVDARFTKRAQGLLPSDWHQYTVRTRSLKRSGHSPRSAADPINAPLNYGGSVALSDPK
jgi:hypothetical protein